MLQTSMVASNTNKNVTQCVTCVARNWKIKIAVINHVILTNIICNARENLKLIFEAFSV